MTPDRIQDGLRSDRDLYNYIFGVRGAGSEFGIFDEPNLHLGSNLDWFGVCASVG